MEEHNGNWGWIIPLIIGLLIAHFFWPTKYEGETAEYWYNQYDEAQGMYEDQVSLTDEKVDCLSEIESEASYYSFDDYGELQDKIDNVNSKASFCQ